MDVGFEGRELFVEVGWVLAGQDGIAGEGRELFVEVGWVLAGQDGIAGEESVFEGVLRDAGFAFLGAGTGGFLCVLTISFNLRIRSHHYYSFRGSG